VPTISAIGTAVPSYKTTQLQHESILLAANGIGRKQKLQIRKIYAGTGIESRYSVLNEFSKEDQTGNTLFYPSDLKEPMPISQRMDIYEHTAPVLAAQAVRECLASLPALQLSGITHIITFSCTGMSAPGLDIQLVDRLGLARSVERTCINFMGCYAGINAMKTARHISRSEPGAIILLAGVELSSLHYQRNEGEDQIIANALFADGAAAAIVSSEPLPASHECSLGLKSFYSEFEPGEREEMAWRIGEHGFDLRLSTFVPGLIKKHIPALVGKLFEHAKISCFPPGWL
jgi:alpha-pyrone synthase